MTDHYMTGLLKDLDSIVLRHNVHFRLFPISCRRGLEVSELYFLSEEIEGAVYWATASYTVLFPGPSVSLV